MRFQMFPQGGWFTGGTAFRYDAAVVTWLDKLGYGHMFGENMQGKRKVRVCRVRASSSKGRGLERTQDALQDVLDGRYQHR